MDCQGEEGGGGPSLPPFLPQHVHIPTMENGPQLILRFYKELKAIQVRCTSWERGWMLGCPREVPVPRASELRLPLPHPPP